MSALERSIREIVRGDESDGELDKIVADLIVREAQEKNRLARDGQGSASRASSSGSSIRRSLNTRFLNGIVKGVERHNRHLKDDEERSVVTARGRTDERQERDEKGPSTDRMHGWKEDEQVEKIHHSPIASSSNLHKDLSHTKRDHSKRKHRKHDSKYEERKFYDHADSRRRDSKSYRSSEPESKMDKYFKSDYDPAIDVDTKVSINQDNLVEDEGWERAMSLIQERKKQKEERRESRKMERERKRSKRDDKKRRRTSEDDDDDEHKSRDKRYRGKKDYPNESKNPILEKRYSAKGSIREWDKGKN